MTSFESLDRLHRHSQTPPKQLFEETALIGPDPVAPPLKQATERQLKALPETGNRCQLAQAQKLEAVSRVTGGIAHNFNNLLTAIVGYCHLLGDDSKNSQAANSYLVNLMASADRATDLVKQLLAFSQQQILTQRNVDMNQVVNKCEPLLRRLAGYQVELELDLESALGSVRVDRGQLEGVISSLATNAIEAMPNGGRLSIKTRRLDLDGFSVSDLGIPEGHYVMLEVEDTGVGIDETIYDRIFEPFFSTKEELNGTGLGLSVVYGTVKQNGGHLRVESSREHGSRFKVYFPENPSRDEALSDLPKVTDSLITGAHVTVSEAHHDPPNDRKTILLAEDDPTVRQALRTFLSHQGHHVLSARDGLEGREISNHYMGKIDLLLTDIVMPKLDGLQLAQRIHAERADTKVLFISGYAHDREMLCELVDRTDVEFLEKPFQNESLDLKLRTMFGTPPRSSSPRAAA